MKINYTENFKELVESEGYEVLSVYKNTRTKVKLKCPEGHEWNVLPNDFKKGSRCPICPIIQAKEQFIELLVKEGYGLLSEYKNTRIKVEIRCDKGHEYNVIPNSFKQGSRCPKCPTNGLIRAKEQFIDLLDQEGYKLLSEYKNTQIKVKLKCDKEHIYEVLPSNFKSGNRCPKCLDHCPIQAKKEFLELLESEGYELLSEYKNTRTKVKIRCPKNHIYEVKPNTFKNGIRCPKCAGVCPEQAKEQFKELVESEGYKLLSEYKNNNTKVKIICNKGHEYSVTPNHFKSGSRCPKCAGTCSIQAKEQFMNLLESEGYKLLSDYKNALIKVKLKCPAGHVYEVTPHSFKTSYNRCPHCKGSSGQRLLQKMLEEYNIGKVIYNNRKILGGLELDIYYPDLNIAIEYQGNYWHNRQEVIGRDKKKKKLCKERGIKLIEVWDDDFLKNPDQILKETIYKIQEPLFS